MDLGSSICTPKKPACALCPLNDDCMARARGDQETFPRKAPKKAGTLRQGAAFVVIRGDELLVRTRPERGLLGGMTEVPTSDWLAGQDGKVALKQAPLLKGVARELERARALIAEGDFFNSARLLRRGNHMLEYPISMLHELETITPYDYHLIRAGLGHGSGLDSPGFLALLHIGPRLGEAFQSQLDKLNLTVDDLYRRHTEFFGLHDVAERLLDFDERVHLFRFHHLKLAQRIIGGGVVGTMGTPVEVLHQRMEHLFYKDLWDVRNRITAQSMQG